MMNTYRQQLVLLYLGYNPGSPDGIRGTMTADAIEDFQRDNGLTHDRIWGAKTEAKARYNFDHDVFKPEQEAVDTTTPVTDTAKRRPRQRPTRLLQPAQKREPSGTISSISHGRNSAARVESGATASP